MLPMGDYVLDENAEAFLSDAIKGGIPGEPAMDILIERPLRYTDDHEFGQQVSAIEHTSRRRRRASELFRKRALSRNFEETRW